jgi:hypothetical protein
MLLIAHCDALKEKGIVDDEICTAMIMCGLYSIAEDRCVFPIHGKPTNRILALFKAGRKAKSKTSSVFRNGKLSHGCKSTSASLPLP